MNEEITQSQNKGLNFVLKLPDLNKDLITPLTDAIMMDIHRRTNLSQLYLGATETYFKPPFLHVNLMFQNGDPSTVKAAFSVLRPLYILNAIMDKLTSSQAEKFLEQIHQWHEQHPTKLLMPYDRFRIEILLPKECDKDYQSLKTLFKTPLDILEKSILNHSTSPYYHIETEVVEKDGIHLFSIYIGSFLGSVDFGRLSNKRLFDDVVQTIKYLATSQGSLEEKVMFNHAVAKVMIDPEDPDPQATIDALIKHYHKENTMREEKPQAMDIPSSVNDVYRLKFDEKYPIPKPNVIIHNLLPELLRTYLRRKCDQSNYLIHDLEINISETELQLSFEYAKKDGTKFNRLAPAFGYVMNSSWDPLSLKLFFEVLNKQLPLTGNDFIFSIHQYFEGNPTQHEFPIKYLKFEVNSALQDDTEENILKANQDHYFEALNKITRYLNKYCQSPFYRTVTSVRNKDDKSKFEVSIYSFLNALDLEMIQQQEYVKSALLVPSVELEFNE